ncbi:Trk system potassium transporter TrkA [Halanaeroarchaeum sulfurireducens]|uniref:Potassium transporter peripheral membrane component n=1 Tax=Halanaeroarchaeum sulfurireducens TaxID=1604004 RepID=A0A0F7PAM7_9EURY|nr:Trk system potassium transporter TrkA [Halanaeroarchaeum sulfurireducens]AKH98231.1 potassium transporter peripheral membrane component [Halanaeroarchaeum sulfurireducens]
MRLLVIGAGDVGSSIAASLSDSHDVVVVDIDRERVDSLTYEYDVLPIHGDGTSLEVLDEAEAREAEVVIASTDSDETNLAISGTIKTISDAFTIARVEKPTYYRTWQRSKGAFGTDFMVCSDLLTAQAIGRLIGLPTARDVDLFAGGTVQMAEFEVPPTSALTDWSIQEADRFDGLTFAAIVRDGEVILPSGEDVFEPADRVVVIGPTDSVRKFGSAVTDGKTIEGSENVVIVGGSSIGEQVAKLLEERDITPRLFEADSDRARSLAEELPSTTVMEHDATDLNFLEREHVAEADLLVATLDSDEKTLLTALVARRVGVERTVAVVEESQYVELFEAVGVDVAVNPRQVTGEEIIRFTRDRRAENVAIIESGAAEVIELEIDTESILIDRPIKEGISDLPDGVIIGAITRGGEFVVPRGDTVIEEGDHVVVFAREAVVDDVLHAM